MASDSADKLLVVLESPGMDACGQMALDEALLDSKPAGGNFLRFYRWNGPAVTFGYFQRYRDARESLPPGLAALGDRLAVVRRPTGGGVVLHDCDLTFSFIFEWTVSFTPPVLYRNIHRGVHLGLKTAGLASRIWSPSRKEPVGAGCGPEEYWDRAGVQGSCFQAPSPLDLVQEDGRKILGGALRKRGGIGLYQGSLRLPKPARSIPGLEDAVVQGFSLEWGFRVEPAEAPKRLLEAAELLARQRYRTDDWNQKR